jgi:23S rRNA C2498 (ribose-2'-O)-methylase RlmM
LAGFVVLAASTGDDVGTRWLDDLCFPHFALLLPQEVRGDSVNALARLKGGALDHALIEHRCQDAFRYAPPRGSVFEWMFCDLVEDPHRVLANLVHSWLSHGWCRRFVVVLKFGRTDALGLLREVRAADSPFTLYARHLRIHHLFHNRKEFTVVGEVTS